jgi:tRNA (guanine37-N1)-methyltransferase
MRIDILTIFPKIFDSYFNESIIKKAQRKKLLNIKIHNIRNFSLDKHKKVDDKPYGGGAGMVMMAEPILRAFDSIPKHKKSKTIIFSAKGKQFDQKMAYRLAKFSQLILISGRYEGIDERVRIALKAQEISIGPYVLTDGDVAAQVLVSAIVRLIPGVIKERSLKEESFGGWEFKGEKENLLRKGEYPQYTRPEVLIYKKKKYRVPKVLLSGNHKKIEQWRQNHLKIIE